MKKTGVFILLVAAEGLSRGLLFVPLVLLWAQPMGYRRRDAWAVFVPFLNTWWMCKLAWRRVHLSEPYWSMPALEVAA